MKRRGQYLSGDLHMHTFLSDGSHTLLEVADKAFNEFGLSFLVVTDHGGAFRRDSEGKDFSQNNLISIRGEEYGKKGYMWRSQSIEQFGAKDIENVQRCYPDKLILHGLEFNIPRRGHIGVLILKGLPQSLSMFEYLFDYSDLDQSLQLEKYNKEPDDVLKAIDYLKKHYANDSYFIINHPFVYKAFTPRLIRTLNDRAPDIVVGFEGIPGHQFRSMRGCYMYEKGNDFMYYRTYGGADYMLSQVGGIWDSLLGEGRRFFVFAGSDFHTKGDNLDPLPGEYAKTYLYFENLNEQELLSSIRKGNAFVTTGDLIDELYFFLEHNGESATLGETLLIAKEDKYIDLTIRLRLGSAVNPLDHIDLIGGSITGKFLEDSPLYDSLTNDTTSILLTVKCSDLKENVDGYLEFSLRIELPFLEGYFRLRGTNLQVNTPYETDERGNPLIDDWEIQANNKEIALMDSWFYSNPIFYKKL